MSKPLKALDVLNRLLSRETLTDKGVDAVRLQLPKEGLHHDFKAGLVAKKDPDAFKKWLRKYVTSFANSDGGFLLLGITELKRVRGGKERRVDGLKPQGGQGPASWCRDAISAYAGFLSPPPEIQEIRVGGKTVVVLAVARAPQLIPLTDRGSTLYAFRMYDGTVIAPDYLVSDLILGRRQHPVLELETITPGGSYQGKRGDSFAMGAFLRVRNDSLVFAEDVKFGAVAWGFLGKGERIEHRRPSESLLRYVRISTPSVPAGIAETSGVELWHIQTAPTGSGIEPFESVGVEVQLRFNWGSGQARFAFFAMPRRSPPTFWEVPLRYGLQDAGTAQKKGFCTLGEPRRIVGDDAPVVDVWDLVGSRSE